MLPRSLRPLFPYLRKYRGSYLIGTVCVFINNGVWILFPLVLRRAVDGLQGGVTREKLLTYSLELMAVAAIKGVFQFLTRWIVIGISREIEFDLRNDLFRHLESLSYSYYQRTRTGDIMARATNDLNAVRMLLGPAIMYSANTIVFTAGALAFMLSISPRLTLYAFLPLPAGEHHGAVFRETDSRALREDPGHVFRNLRPGAGEFFGRTRDPRLCAGRTGNRRLRNLESRIHQPEPEAGPPDGHAVAHAGNHAGPGDRAGAVARRAGSAAWPDDDRRLRRFQHLHGAADLAGDRAGLGH